MSNRILVIGSDTVHRRFILNRLLERGLPLIGCLFETDRVVPPFKTGPSYEEKESAYLNEVCFKSTPKSLDRLPHWYIPTADHVDALAKIRDLKPGIGLSSGAGLLKKEVIDLFPNGILNVHLGIAEEYRGLDSNLWAIYHRDWDNIGVTLHLVDQELDTGPIVEQRQLHVPPGAALHELRYHESCLAIEMIEKALTDWMTGTLRMRKQSKRGRYYSFMPRDLRILVEQRFNKHFRSAS